MTQAPAERCTLAAYKREFAGRHLLGGVIRKWAAEKPESPAIINATRNEQVDWRTLEAVSTGLAVELLRLGFRKGDFLAASLPLTNEHIFLEYACFRIGVIHTPLDLRLKPAEVLKCLQMVRARGYAFPGRTPAADFRELGRAVKAHCPFVEHLIQFSPEEDAIEGAAPIGAFLGPGKAASAGMRRACAEAAPGVTEYDGAQAIFTTGSTGAPKPALLSHRGITVQNLCLGAAFGFDEGTRMLVNLPPSHVGAQAEILMTTLFWGGTAVTLEVFDAAKSLEAIERHRVNLVGQIPAMFNMEWRLSNYAGYDLSSLKAAVYGGQQVARPFLEKLAAMAPRIATGLGLTETSGFCTYTPLSSDAGEAAASLGHAMPVYPMTIREPMREDGTAGGELPEGEAGHVCFRGPQTFLGYVNDPEATARTISRDGWLYTGDMGHVSSKGLHFAGRAKWVIKPAGYQVFPGEVESAICALEEKVAGCGVVGAPHAVRSEAIVAFVERRPGAGLTAAELKQHARSMASFLRPLHFVILEPGQMPLNRVAKIDYMRLQQMALEEVGRLREQRRWDR